MKKSRYFLPQRLPGSWRRATTSSAELSGPVQSPDPRGGVFENPVLRLPPQSSADVNLIEASNKNENVAVARIDELVNFPEGRDTASTCRWPENQFGKYATVKTTIADNLVHVTPPTSTPAIREAITPENPAKLNVATRFVAYAEKRHPLFPPGGMDDTIMAATSTRETT